MKKYRYAAPVAIMAAIIAITLARSRSAGELPSSRSALMMDTLVEARVWGEGRVPREAAADSALAALAGIDRLLGDARLETASDGELLRSPTVGRLLAVSRKVYDLTGGSFDPTIGSVTRLWNFGEDAVVPAPDSVARALGDVGLPTFLTHPDSAGFVLDLGGVAKGYAIDLAASRLEELGFKSAIVSAGGDMKLVGRRPDGKPWRIAIRHPRIAGAFAGYLNLEDTAVATSGDYERCFFSGGRRYHHILDPRSGMPAAAGAVSVTVVAPSGVLADALATGLFVMGPSAGLRLAEELPDVEAVFIYAEGESLAVTSGLAGKFERERLD